MYKNDSWCILILTKLNKSTLSLTEEGSSRILCLTAAAVALAVAAEAIGATAAAATGAHSSRRHGFARMPRRVWSEQARWGDARRAEGAGWMGRLRVCAQGATRGARARCSERGERVIGRGRCTITSATIYDY